MPFRPGEGGRPRGAKNRASKLRDRLDRLARSEKGRDSHVERLHALMLSDDEHVAVKALQLMFAYRFGKPAQTVLLEGVPQVPLFALPVGLMPSVVKDKP